MRILFSVRNPAYIRHYDGVLRALAARGHTVELAVEDRRSKPWPASVVALAEACPSIRLSRMPTGDGTPWFELATRLRQARFYLRFLDPMYAGTPGLLARTRAKAPPAAVRLAEGLLRGRRRRRLLVQALDLLERAASPSAGYHDYLRRQQPDVVVLTPLVVLKTSQLDLARAAIELGIRNAFAVASWDHLSSKGELTFAPQRVIVWNEVQRREAAVMHGIPADRIVITGAQVFDDWFDRRPSLSREAFCARIGLPPDRPIVLYVCSALLEGSPPEAPFVLRWIGHLRASSHQALRDCGILVRPHFKRGDEWRGLDFRGLGPVACWPPAGQAVVDGESKAGYFDSLYHASTTVGLNTSALVEAAILGRPVHTVLLPEFRESQEGTVHFRYLLDGPDALLHATRDLDAHARELACVLEGHDPDPGRSLRFVRRFVRPGPPEVPATTRFVDAIESLAAGPPPAPQHAPAWTKLLRPLLAPFAASAARRVRRQIEERRRLKAARVAERRRARLHEG